LPRAAPPWLVLEHSLLDDALQGQGRIRDLDLWTHLETKLTDQLHVLGEAIVENDAGCRDGVLATGPLEVEIPELDLDFSRLGNSRVRGDERAVSPSGCRDKQSGEERREDLNPSRPRRRTSSMRADLFLVPRVRTRGASVGRRRGCESSARRGRPAAF